MKLDQISESDSTSGARSTRIVKSEKSNTFTDNNVSILELLNPLKQINLTSNLHSFYNFKELRKQVEIVMRTQSNLIFYIIHQNFMCDEAHKDFFKNMVGRFYDLPDWTWKFYQGYDYRENNGFKTLQGLILTENRHYYQKFTKNDNTEFSKYSFDRIWSNEKKVLVSYLNKLALEEYWGGEFKDEHCAYFFPFNKSDITDRDISGTRQWEAISFDNEYEFGRFNTSNYKVKRKSEKLEENYWFIASYDWIDNSEEVANDIKFALSHYGVYASLGLENFDKIINAFKKRADKHDLVWKDEWIPNFWNEEDYKIIRSISQTFLWSKDYIIQNEEKLNLDVLGLNMTVPWDMELVKFFIDRGYGGRMSENKAVFDRVFEPILTDEIIKNCLIANTKFMNEISKQFFFRRDNNKLYKDSYTNQDHIKFLDMELHAQNVQFSKVINRKAGDLLQDGLLIPAKFLKVENGHLIVKISKTRAIPRKGEYLTAVLLEGDMPDNRNWDEKSWRELRLNHQIAISEAICVWQTASKDSRFNLVGFRSISMEFASRLIEDCIIIFGPKEPPREYLMNLRQIAENKTENSTFLDFEYLDRNWDPSIFDSTRNFPNYVIKQLELFPHLIIQGPPGTGKTYKLAELISVLLEQNKKVLVTALTNRALIELAKKEHLKTALEQGWVTKNNLTTDEVNELPELQNRKKDEREAELILSTFYLCSKDAAKAFSPYYDYVIMDEASQALLGMFEATIRLGKKVIWIGDQNQLPPIVMAEEKEIKHSRSIPLIQGMKTVCEAFAFPSLMLNQTFRLSNRGAKFTSYFYANELVSAKHQPEKYYYHNLSDKMQFLFHREGGPFWLKLPMKVGEKCPIDSIQFVSQIVKTLHLTDKDLHIAVISKLKKTVTQLQVHITSEIGDTEKVLVDTVERVQGMTCDICIFFIPNTSLSMSLHQAFFNVATSRASRHTIIVADSSILNSPSCKEGTRQYLESLNSVENSKILELN